MPGSRLELLLIDDDPLIADSLELCLPEAWNLEHSTNIQDMHLRKFYNAAFVDMHLTPGSRDPLGIKVIEKLSQAHPHLEIIAISGDLDRELMEGCLKAGAGRFLSKPLNPEEVTLLLAKIEALWQLRDPGFSSLRAPTPWVGSSSISQEIRKQIANLAGEQGPILIEGESGTGKEVIAGLLHSQKKSGPFVAVNVAAIPEDLFESEFFGHIKGAFTGADRSKIGLAEAANGGDLFLDEIEALPLHLQAKLLRFLESGELRRVGGQETQFVSARVIAATNRNLEELVSTGKFREDLLWRLSGKKITIPPLRERPEDVAELAQNFLDKQRPYRDKKLSEDAVMALTRYPWPGNVRELKRVCEQLSINSPLPIIRAQDVNGILPVLPPAAKSANNFDLSQGLSAIVQSAERNAILYCLELEPDIENAAKILQISRSSLYKKMKDYQIDSKKD